jgi:crotonobetainyl-CoA:carnitine CoA-transferase CaiB-like acyl-CoA transferase/acylphosphatase
MSRPPLRGLRVLDVSHNLAGPLTAMHLGDLGAEVVKVEGPAGDDWRDHERIPGHPGRSRHHLQLNRNKRAVCLDLRRPEAREVMNDLIAAVDVLVTNLRPGVPERLGFGWEDARALNPALVYCAISAFGAAGALEGRPGYDLQAQALTGFMAQADDGEPFAGPVPVTDTAVPLLACAGILAALVSRASTGRGQLVDASLLGTAVALNAHSLVRIDDLPEHGVRTFSRAFFRPYRTADGWLVVAANAERLARSFCEAIGLPGLLDEPPWDDRAVRVEREAELVALVAPRMRERTGGEWERRLADAGVPASPVRERDALFDDPDARAAGLLAGAHDPELGTLTMTAPVLRLSETPGSIRFPGRRLGQDTRAVLRETGRTDEQIDRLVQAAAAVCEPGAMRRRVVAHGRVQGVFFRESLRRLAAELGVAGYARNLPNGTLEAAFEGPEDAVLRMVEFAHAGPPDADVEGMDVMEESPIGLSGFTLT